MRLIMLAAFVFFTTFCIIVAVSNGDEVVFSLAPFPISATLPAYMLIFMGIVIGLGAGWGVSLMNSFRHATQRRRDAKHIGELEKTLKDLSNPPTHEKTP